MKKRIETYYDIDCLLTISEVCRILNISKQTFYRSVYNELEKITVGKNYRFEPRVVIQFIEVRKIKNGKFTEREK